MIKVLYLSDRPFGETAYPNDAGIDLPIIGEHILSPGESKDIPSGIKLAIPVGYYGRITGRSSALRKRNIKVHEGIIDAGFRGELFSYVTNEATVATALTTTDRVAQLIIQPVVTIEWQHTDTLPGSTRGSRGFGSSDGPATDGYDSFPPSVSQLLTAYDKLIYLGGPIDHATDNGRWRAMWTFTLVRSGYRVFDPQAQAQGMIDPQAIYEQNMAAIASSDACLFNFANDPPGAYGFGSPIEIAYAISERKLTIVIHPIDTAGVYLRKLWKDGLVIVPSVTEALNELTRSIRV